MSGGSAPPSTATTALQLLINLARVTDEAIDNSSETGTCQHRLITIGGAELVELEAALDELNTLPDDRPGYVMSGPARAEWAVRGLMPCELTQTATPEGRTQAARDVLAERARQINAEGWTPEHDDHHHNGELAAAAACYASPHRAFKAVTGVGRGYESLTIYRDLWPWRGEWWKPKDRRADLVRAGALILAEIERLDRAASQDEQQEKQG